MARACFSRFSSCRRRRTGRRPSSFSSFSFLSNCTALVCPTFSESADEAGGKPKRFGLGLRSEPSTGVDADAGHHRGSRLRLQPRRFLLAGDQPFFQRSSAFWCVAICSSSRATCSSAWHVLASQANDAIAGEHREAPRRRLADADFVRLRAHKEVGRSRRTKAPSP